LPQGNGRGNLESRQKIDDRNVIDPQRILNGKKVWMFWTRVKAVKFTQEDV